MIERTYESSCAGKHQHKTREKALKHLGRMGQHQRFMQIYACPFCGFYHIGHQPGTASKVRSDKHLRKRRGKKGRPSLRRGAW